MITVSRSLIRQFRSVARRAGLQRTSNSQARLVTNSNALTVQASNGQVAIQYQTSGEFSPTDITVPFQLFVDCEAKSEAPVTIRLENDNRIVATWDDRGVPQHRTYDLLPTAVEMPPMPSEWATNGPELLIALRDAKATADTSSTRYALESLQFRGATGTIVATDSRQLLLQAGFQFPFSSDLLVKVSNVFASSELPSGQPVDIGATTEGMTVRVGNWTIFHELNKDGRFPNIDRTIPGPDAISSRMKLDPADAQFFLDTVGLLPADNQADRPLTVELNGEVVVRARDDEPSPLTELVLTRSQRIGNQLRLLTNRRFLTRAIELGFSEIGFVDAQSPCVCRDATRTYIWMLLEPKDALASSDNARRIESATVSANPTPKAAKAIRAQVFQKPTVLANRVSGHLSAKPARGVRKQEQSATSAQPPRTSDVIEQALELRNQLRSIAVGLNDLVARIRQQRRQNRIMKSTLQSLKQLQLIDA